MNKRNYLNIFSAALLAISFLGCADSSDDNKTNLRFMNAVVGVGDVDLMIDSDQYLENVAYLESTAYLEFDTDPHLFQVTPSNSLTPIDSQLTSLQDDVDYTYIACGTSSEAEAILLRDDNEPGGDASFRARIINVFKKGASFDVYVLANPNNVDLLEPTAKRIGYKAATRYQAGSAGRYDIVVRRSTTKETVATLAGQDFKSESVYSILLVADAADPTKTKVLVLTDRDKSN
jgi:hypothetical protein